MATSKSKTYYATSAIKHGAVDDDGNNTFYTVNEDEEVDKSKFSDDEFQALVDAGSVTTTPPEQQAEEDLTPEEQMEKSISEVAGPPKAEGPQKDAGK